MPMAYTVRVSKTHAQFKETIIYPELLNTIHDRQKIHNLHIKLWPKHIQGLTL
jgi:hypothetical protein